MKIQDKRGGGQILQGAEVNDLEDKEVKSMMKFATFLQQQVFLRRPDDAPTQSNAQVNKRKRKSPYQDSKKRQD